MNLDEIRKDREKWLNWKNIKPLRDVIDSLEDVDCAYTLGDVVEINSKDTLDQKKIEDNAKVFMPWRKGPFKVFDTYIDTEWLSYKKYNLLKKYFNLENKTVADVGCNNGYYMFKMLEDKPKKLVGFDPSALYKSQFDFINHYIKSDIEYELLGVEHLEFYEHKFDVIFCLGVLYHRSDPISMLKSLKKSLENDGIVYLDTFMIDGDEPFALCPESSYSKIPNISFVPTIPALKNWCLKAGFKEFEVLETSVTTIEEQRKSDWIEGQSLDDFLDPNDKTKTVEGYDAPKRVYVRLKR